MADGRVLTISASCLQNNLYNWDLGEILRYNEANSFTYVGNRIKWIDTFEMLKIFTKNAIGHEGKWISPGGKYKKFVSSNCDLTITWNHELGTLTFKINVGDNLKELFVNINFIQLTTTSRRIAYTLNMALRIKTNCCMLTKSCPKLVEKS